MPQRKSVGCLGILVTGALLYTITTALLSSSQNVRTSAFEIGEIRDALASARSSGAPAIGTPAGETVAGDGRLVSFSDGVALTEMTPMDGWGVVTAPVLNQRAAPSTEADIVGTLAAGVCVHLVGAQNGWYRTLIEGSERWSSAEFISVVEVCPG